NIYAVTMKNSYNALILTRLVPDRFPNSARSCATRRRVDAVEATHVTLSATACRSDSAHDR
ncbi:hypothetical protein AAVH_15538, partial [Aphelenchoides avenae]